MIDPTHPLSFSFLLPLVLHLYLEVKFLNGLPQLETHFPLLFDGILLTDRHLFLLLNDVLNQPLLVVLPTLHKRNLLRLLPVLAPLHYEPPRRLPLLQLPIHPYLPLQPHGSTYLRQQTRLAQRLREALVLLVSLLLLLLLLPLLDHVVELYLLRLGHTFAVLLHLVLLLEEEHLLLFLPLPLQHQHATVILLPIRQHVPALRQYVLRDVLEYGRANRLLRYRFQ